jgi:hypothetical protein
MEYDNNNRGVLFSNDKKGNENAPDFKGHITVTADMVGRQVDLACWKQTSAAGNPYMSLSVSEPFKPQAQGEPSNFNQAPAQPKPSNVSQAPAQSYEEEIPF